MQVATWRKHTELTRYLAQAGVYINDWVVLNYSLSLIENEAILNIPVDLVKTICKQEFSYYIL